MNRLVLAILALLLLAAPLQAAAAPPPTLDPMRVIEWATPQLDAFYRTLFILQGQEYRSPRVSIVDPAARTATGCGVATGKYLAFYCPADEQIVIGTDIIAELAADDEFLPAYVLAHEWAHHAQRLSGTAPVITANDGDWNQVYTIENELRADCLSGVWMRNVAERDLLDATDVSAVLVKASEIGGGGLYGRRHGHGDGVERLRAVFFGYEEGIMACMAITPLERGVV